MPSYVSILYVDALVEHDSKYHDCSFPPKCNHKEEVAGGSTEKCKWNALSVKPSRQGRLDRAEAGEPAAMGAEILCTSRPLDWCGRPAQGESASFFFLFPFIPNPIS